MEVGKWGVLEWQANKKQAPNLPQSWSLAIRAEETNTNSHARTSRHRGAASSSHQQLKTTTQTISLKINACSARAPVNDLRTTTNTFIWSRLQPSLSLNYFTRKHVRYALSAKEQQISTKFASVLYLWGTFPQWKNCEKSAQLVFEHVLAVVSREASENSYDMSSDNRECRLKRFADDIS